MTMLTPNDPGSGRLFFWTRQGISLQQLYDLIAEAIASGGVPGVPGTPGAPGSGISSESPTFTGTTAVTNLAVSGTVALPDGSLAMADVAGLTALAATVGALAAPATKASIGLGSVDNTADIDKPLSTLMQLAFARIRIPWKQVGGLYPTPVPSGFFGITYEGVNDPADQAGLTVTNNDTWVPLP